MPLTAEYRPVRDQWPALLQRVTAAVGLLDRHVGERGETASYGGDFVALLPIRFPIVISGKQAQPLRDLTH